jgi:5-methylthioadenosine/S-adenosylhomocysteine deaminase
VLILLLAAELTLKGTVVTPTAVLTAAAVTIKGDRIVSVEPVKAATPGIAIDDVIFPGLIDLHNHLTWNVLPDWHPGRLFTNRSQWRTAPDYLAATEVPYGKMIDKGLACDMNRFGEVKALVNGGTVTVGSYGPGNTSARNRCIDGLVRNIDYAADLTSPPVMNHEPLSNYVDPLSVGEADAQRIRGTGPALLHVAEGTDAAAHDEFQALKDRRFLRRGVSIIHGIALTPADFAEMARAGAGLIWSPHGHFVLYGKTADILAAMKAGVTTAIGPDWSPTGSTGMIEELNFANRYNTESLNRQMTEAQLVAMATINPAKLAGIDRQLGSIEAGKLADLVVVKRHGRTAYEALLTATPGDIQLVMIGGEPLYGDRALMVQLLPRATLENVTICGQPKALHIAAGNAAYDSWQNTRTRLSDVMKGLGIAPSALVTCAAAR